MLRGLGAEVIPIGVVPDGRNINLNCGALHLDSLRERVLAEKATLGVGFYGDADRAMFIAGSGRLVDGDGVLLLTADWLRRHGKLSDSSGQETVVATVMSNFGLEKALQDRGLQMVRAAVGDKYVLEEMIRRGAHVGGEQSGHIIFPDFATTGDGMLTALRVFAAMIESGRSLDDLTADLKVFPQILLNLKVREKRPIEQMEQVQSEIRRTIDGFGGAGRVLVRYSGTESLARVMVEGPDQPSVEQRPGGSFTRLRLNLVRRRPLSPTDVEGGQSCRQPAFQPPLDR